MRIKVTYTLISILIMSTSFAQSYTLGGKWTNLNNKEVRLVGYIATKDTVLSSTRSDDNGRFKLSYPAAYVGAASIQVKDGKSVNVILNKENFEIDWNNIDDFKGLVYYNSQENTMLSKCISINQDIQSKLSAWQYLLPLYKNGDSNSKQTVVSNIIQSEIEVLRERLPLYLQTLPKQSFVKHYVGFQNIWQEMQLLHQKEEFQPRIVEMFQEIDLTSAYLEHSGLYTAFLKTQLENILKKDVNNAIVTLNELSDTIVSQLKNKPILFNEVSDYLFKYYEQYGLTDVARHLALSLLGADKCMLDTKRINLFEQYRKMALGQIAKDIVIDKSVAASTVPTGIDTTYKIIVFGASWCHACKNELPQLNEYVQIFKTKYNASIVYVSLDTNKNDFEEMMKSYDFLSTCDYKGWEGKNVKNYYVMATPTFFILDKNNTILAKPNGAIATAKWLSEHVQQNTATN